MSDFRDTHWALLDLKYTYLWDGFKFFATTDVPCHLYLRMTLIPPRKHVFASPRRGIYLQGDIRFCFVVYEDNEQDEAGDTLTHTWFKRTWPHCQTRWLYFVGSQAGITSVSETSIFRFHFTKLPPSMLLVFTEPWTYYIDLVTRVFYEPWTYRGAPPPVIELVFTEPWTYAGPPPPAMAMVFTEPWTYYSTPPPSLNSVFTEPWDSYLSLTQVFLEPWTD